MRTVKEVLMQAMEGFIRLETKQSYQRDRRNLIVDLTTTLGAFSKRRNALASSATAKGLKDDRR